ncbi:cytochrome P450 [Amycolatopsis magusensis]|uniref:Cytochrome P450 n=1 Tax=Amycolatopsis magusensis TaxID=882444 RepID=A0ABS4PU61_9PSEU|nr:cytochrome P450 [Amycolatopsis magusensis]MBP2182955.1 cytochrome P450 [Amycolatopsis magusensis]
MGKKGTARQLPPGPSGVPILGKHMAFLRNPLDFLMQAHLEFGPLVSLPVNGRTVVAAFGAEQVQAVVAGYGKEVDISMAGGVDLEFKGSIQGRGPLNASGAEHALFRRVTLRALRNSANSYAAVSMELTQRLLAGWTPGTEVDLLRHIPELSRRIFKYYMFGSDIGVTDPELDAAVDEWSSALDSIPRRIGSALLPYNVPGLSRGRSVRRSMSIMDARVAAIGDGSVKTRHFSLIEAVLQEMERADLNPNPALARELATQLYFAGLTSVGGTIVWTLLLLALHPKPTSDLLGELDREFGGRVPEPGDDAKQLPVFDAILDESMRLYPGSAYEFKRVHEDLEVDGYRLRSGSPLLLAPWVTQRSPDNFEDPERFRPERFAGRQRAYHKASFAPWGFGNRSCVGKGVSRTAIRTVVAGITQRYRLDLVPHQRIDVHSGSFGIRVLPRPGVRVRLARQDGETARSATPVTGSVVHGVPGQAGTARD